MKSVKIIIEQHEDGFIGYPLGRPFGFEECTIIGRGSTYQEALDATRSAIVADINNYGINSFFHALYDNKPPIQTFLAELDMADILSTAKPPTQRPIGLAEGYFISEKAFDKPIVVLNND